VVTYFQHAAVSGIRDLVRAVELGRDITINQSSQPEPNYGRHHDIARHAIHVSETVALSIKTIEHMLTMHRDLLHQVCRPDSSDQKPRPMHINIFNNMDKRLRFFEHMMHSLTLRSAATLDRLKNEIQLSFNVVSQFDSRASVAISRAAQYDSYSMRSVAFLTMTFLPATFVSAVFSMSFFNYDPNLGWSVSGKIWVYFAIAGPVTAIAVGVWLVWQKLFPLESIVPITPRKLLVGLNSSGSYASGRENGNASRV